MDDDKIREQLNLQPEQPVNDPQQPVQTPMQPIQPMQQTNNNIEQVPMETQYEEPKKRKLRKGTIPKLILSVILFVAGIYLIIFSIRYEEPADTPAENNTTIPDTNQTVNDEYVGVYTSDVMEFEEGVDSTTDGMQKSVIILRADNTFVYDFISNENPTPKVGTYTINNGVISFEEIVSYGSDTCFYTKADKDIVFNSFIGNIENGKLSIPSDKGGESVMREFEKELIPTAYETKYNADWYVVNPINGSSPSNSTNIDQWTNCDNLEN